MLGVLADVEIFCYRGLPNLHIKPSCFQICTQTYEGSRGGNLEWQLGRARWNKNSPGFNWPNLEGENMIMFIICQDDRQSEFDRGKSIPPGISFAC